MPATVPPAPSAHPNGKAPSTASKSQPPRKTRVVQRRGRRPGGMESDDEIVREAASDVDSDASSSFDSESEEDDEEEEEEEEEDNGADRREHSPSTTQSPSLHEHVQLKPPGQDDAGPFARTGTVDWSEMVEGDDELPVIDFKELDSHPVSTGPKPAPARKSKAPSAKKTQTQPSAPAPAPAPAQVPTSPPPTAPDVDDLPSDEVVEDHAGASRPVHARETSRPSRGHHASGFSARQAYQERLEKDPAFVPRIGEFWGHDDRLLDKQLRPLSGYWRSRGRGGFGFRGRGRGGFPGPQNGLHQSISDAPVEGEDGGGPEPPEVPPIERPWTHDGFEELKRRDEQRRIQQQRKTQQQQATPASPRGGPRGRGFVPGTRGRGGFARGGAAAQQGARPADSAPAAAAPDTTAPPPSSTAAPTPRIWYAMKPERVWTKQHEHFLYVEPNMKPRPGVGPGFKIRLPLGDGYVVRAPARANQFGSHKPTKLGAENAHVASTAGQDSVTFVVRLPPLAKEKAETPAPTPQADEKVEVAADPVTVTAEPSAPQPPVAAEAPPSLAAAQEAIPTGIPEPPSAPEPRVFLPRQTFVPEGGLQMDLGPQASGPPTSAVSPASAIPPVPTIPPASPTSEAATSAARPTLAPIAIPTFAPVPQPPQPPPQASPQYGSPYGYPVQLPPGIALNQHGMPYEISTGRPVYLPTPPPQLYAPHAHVPHPGAVPFVPGHMHHHSSMSSMSGSPAPTLPGFIDPATGRPIFTPPRQSSRIEIRAPTEGADGKSNVKSSTTPAQPSTLRTAVSAPASESQGVPPPTMQPAAPEWYPPYPQPYYYPEQQYGYQPYVDMSQMQGYEMYPQPPPEHMQHQSVYY